MQWWVVIYKKKCNHLWTGNNCSPWRKMPTARFCADEELQYEAKISFLSLNEELRNNRIRPNKLVTQGLPTKKIKLPGLWLQPCRRRRIHCQYLPQPNLESSC